MKIYPLFLLVFSSHAIIAMQQPTDFALDETGISEFKKTKEDIIRVAQERISDLNNNKLVQYYAVFAYYNNHDVAKILAQDAMQNRIKELYETVSQKKEYREALEKARSQKNNMELWRAFRMLNGKLIQESLRVKGVYHSETPDTKTYLEKNKDLEPEAGAYVIAGSFLIHFTRQLQRKETGQDIPPLVIN